MCGFCASFDGQTHWSENGPAPTETFDHAARRRRVGLLDRIARHYGCQVENWANTQYIVRSRSGRTELVSNIPAVWRQLTEISGQTPDPLATDLLDALDP